MSHDLCSKKTFFIQRILKLPFIKQLSTLIQVVALEMCSFAPTPTNNIC